MTLEKAHKETLHTFTNAISELDEAIGKEVRAIRMASANDFEDNEYSWEMKSSAEEILEYCADLIKEATRLYAYLAITD